VIVDHTPTSVGVFLSSHTLALTIGDAHSLAALIIYCVITIRLWQNRIKNCFVPSDFQSSSQARTSINLTRHRSNLIDLLTCYTHSEPKPPVSSTAGPHLLTDQLCQLKFPNCIHQGRERVQELFSSFTDQFESINPIFLNQLQALGFLVKRLYRWHLRYSFSNLKCMVHRFRVHAGIH